MSKIHYFQRYSGIENTATNNTLLLFSRIYEYSSLIFAQFLTDLMDFDIDVGISFNQQLRMKNSIPDASMTQNSFKILIETKVDSSSSINQLVRHAQSFNDEQTKILLFLTKTKNDEYQVQKISNKVQGVDESIKFVHLTFEEICNVALELFENYELEMKNLVNDYWEYCNEMNFIDQSKYLMRIVPCGQTIELNKKYGVYFQPSDRGYTNHKYLGIYKQKKVQSIWEVVSVYDAAYKDGILDKTHIKGKQTDEYDGNIISIIEECCYSMKGSNRFFCGKPYETKFVKTSSGGIQGARFVNLNKVLEGYQDVEDIAEQLRQKTWT